MSHNGQEKSALLDQVGERFGKLVGIDRSGKFARRFFQRVPLAELAEMPIDDLARLAAEFLEFARQRTTGEINLRIYNPQSDTHGWESGHTIIEIVNDDMPFLVDSVVLAISELGIAAHLIIHPVMRIERDPGDICSGWSTRERTAPARSNQ